MANIMYKKVLFLFFLLICIYSSVSAKDTGHPSVANQQPLNRLNDVEVFSNAEEVRAVVYFTGRLKSSSHPFFYKNFFQIELPYTNIDSSKQQFNIGDPLIDNIYAFKSSPNTVRLRFMYGQGKSIDKKSLSVEKEMNRMIVSVKRPVEKEKFAGYSGNDVLEGVFASAVPDIHSSFVKMLSSLFILLSGILFMSYIVKRYLLKGEKGYGKNKIIRVLATSYIGTKKTIALVDVANEVLVVGISNNHISMLTKLKNNEAVERLKASSSFSECLDKFIPVRKREDS